METKQQQHTPEPWQFDMYLPRHSADGEWVIRDAHGEIIGRMEFDGMGEEEANARRIVACVNWCAGMDTAALEANVKNDARYADHIARIAAQRDELAAALRDATNRLAWFTEFCAEHPEWEQEQFHQDSSEGEWLENARKAVDEHCALLAKVPA